MGPDTNQPKKILDQLRTDQFFTNRQFQQHTQNTHKTFVNDFYRNILIKLTKRYGEPKTLTEHGKVDFLSKLTHYNKKLYNDRRLQQQVQKNTDKAKVTFSRHLTNDFKIRHHEK